MSCSKQDFSGLSLVEQKKMLRQRARAELKQYFSDAALAKSCSQSACSEFLKSALYKDAPAIFLYMPLADEIDVLPIMKKSLEDKKLVAVPRIKSDCVDMDFCFVNGAKDATVRGGLNVLEPPIAVPPVKITEIPDFSVFLVPGLAFNLEGARLGRGKGYYDRYLSKVKELNSSKKITFCGVCISEIITKAIPTESHDFCMDYLLTESGLVRTIA